MEKRVLKTGEIYRIGDKVLNALRLPDEEIDRIVAAPRIFERVRAGIESARVAVEPENTPASRPFVHIPRRRYAWAAIAIVLVFAGAIGLLNFSKQYYTLSKLTPDVPQPAQPGDVPVPAASFPDTPEIKPVPAGFRKAGAARRAEAPLTVKNRPGTRSTGPAKEVEMGEFQALTYTGDENGGEVGQIVRVEMSRASLFAMGVDIPVENENDKIKTDLLIGFDGVMKGVRVEKKN